MPDDAAPITATLADRHVACPGCGYDLGASPPHGREAICPECGGRWVAGLVHAHPRRAHRVLIVVALAWAAMAATAAAANSWLRVYDTFVVPAVVFVRTSPGGPTTSITIRNGATQAQIQRAAVAGATGPTGWSSVPASRWVPVGAMTMLAAAGWGMLGALAWRRTLGRGLVVWLTVLLVGTLAASAIADVVGAVREVIARS